MMIHNLTLYLIRLCLTRLSTYRLSTYTISVILLVSLLVSFCFVDIAFIDTVLAGWATGKFGSAIDFNGSSTHIDFSSAVYNGVKTISFWMKADDITDRKIMDIDGTDQIEINNSSNIVATSFPGTVSIYIDGVNKTSSPTINTDWHHIVITDTSGVNASASLDIGAVGASYFDGKLDNITFYNYVRTAGEILLDYNAGFAARFGPSGMTCSQDPAGCMDYGLVGYWNMDEGAGATAYDASGNENLGTLTNGPKWTQGKHAGGLDFDGTDDYVDCGSSATLKSATALTIETWVYPNSVVERSILGFSGGFSEGYFLWLASVHGRIGIYLNHVKDYAGSNSLTLSTNEWAHVAITYNGTQLKIYKNGIEGYSSDESGSINYSAAGNLNIGNDVGGSVANFHGTIDEVRIYNRALSTEEIRYHYNRGVPVIHYKFNEGSGTTAHDSAGNVDAEFPAASGNQPTWTTP